jgi:NAD(P)-dependent dehydrogenase (short-subunit alcohol dehydrogenase family)
MTLLEGRVAIVTGGGRGIGRGHCLELARLGAAVVVLDAGVDLRGQATDEQPADAVVREIEAAGGQAIAYRASVTDWDACAEAVRSTVERFGRLDAVVNNAGILRDGMITSMAESDFDDVVAVHLKGTFQMTKHACDHWRSIAKAGGAVSGRIVNTTSGAGLGGNVGQAAYAAAKAGIAGLTLVTALEMARYGVTCNAISPLAETRMTGAVGAGSPVETGAFDPLHPGASSPVVGYLVSEDSAWLSGQVLRVEGNTVIRMQGWEQSADRYRAAGGGFLEAEELVVGMRRAYRAFPPGLVSPVLHASDPPPPVRHTLERHKGLTE